jgi:hypothetical protein
VGKYRKRYSSREKVAILREDPINHVPVSDLCDRRGIQPTLFYTRQWTPFKNLLCMTTSPPKIHFREIAIVEL